MKPLNNIERKAYKRKFIGIYAVSIILIIIVLCGFLQPMPSAKTIIVEKEKPVKIMVQPVYAGHKNVPTNNYHEHDSLIAVIDSTKRKVTELNSFIQSQKDIIFRLQKLPAANNISFSDDAGKTEMAKLREKIKFYDWALRSQIAVTNTLTKENNNLKAKVEQAGKNP